MAIVRVQVYDDEGNPRLSEPADQFIGAVSVPDSVDDRKSEINSVNLGAAGTSLLYTVPAGRTFIASKLLIQCTSSASPTTGPVVSLGFNSPNYREFVKSTRLVGLDAVGDHFVLPVSGIVIPAVASQGVTLSVEDPADAALQATVHLFGYFV